MICKAAKRDGYIVEDPAEFVETVRKGSEQARRPFTHQQHARAEYPEQHPGNNHWNLLATDLPESLG
jgi:hypothetical protein